MDKSISYFDTKIPESMIRFVKLYDFLKNLEDKNIELTYKKIIFDLKFVDEDYHEIAAQIIFFSNLPVFNCDLLSDLAFKLSIYWKRFSSILLNVLSSFNDIICFSRFIYSLYIKGVWKFSDIYSKLNDKNGFYHIFCKQIVENIPNDYKSIIEDLKENEWEKFNNIIEYGYEKDTLEYYLKFDMLDAFKKSFKKSGLGYDSEIKKESFSSKTIRLIDAAAFYSSVKCFDFLHKNGATIDEKTASYTVQGGNKKIFDLIDKMKNISQDSLLSKAVTSHQDNMIELLINKGKSNDPSLSDCVSSINYRAFIYYWNTKTGDSIPSLCVAAKLGLYSFCSYLVTNGFSTRVAMESGLTPLHYAVINRHYIIVDFLLHNSADINRLTRDNKTPLDVAIEMKDDYIIKALYLKGAQTYSNIMKSRT